MEKICEICGKEFEPKYEWQRNCYDCFKAGKVPKSKKKEQEDKVVDALREIWSVLNDIRELLKK
jgi:hypothetical protein